MAVGSQYSGIPISLLRRCRAVISRTADPSGRSVWVAEIPDLPSCRATGSSRMEALDRVREMAARGALS
jgi:predicted RNase H-like HicB family nuclease